MLDVNCFQSLTELFIICLSLDMSSKVTPPALLIGWATVPPCAQLYNGHNHVTCPECLEGNGQSCWRKARVPWKHVTNWSTDNSCLRMYFSEGLRLLRRPYWRHSIATHLLPCPFQTGTHQLQSRKYQFSILLNKGHTLCLNKPSIGGCGHHWSELPIAMKKTTNLLQSLLFWFY